MIKAIQKLKSLDSFEHQEEIFEHDKMIVIYRTFADTDTAWINWLIVEMKMWQQQYPSSQVSHSHAVLGWRQHVFKKEKKKESRLKAVNWLTTSMVQCCINSYFYSSIYSIGNNTLQYVLKKEKIPTDHTSHYRHKLNPPSLIFCFVQGPFHDKVWVIELCGWWCECKR